MMALPVTRENAKFLSPGLPQFLDKSFGLLHLHQNRSASGYWWKEHQTLAVSPIHPHFLATCNPEPPGMIVRETDAVGAGSRAPV